MFIAEKHVSNPDAGAEPTCPIDRYFRTDQNVGRTCAAYTCARVSKAAGT